MADTVIDTVYPGDGWKLVITGEVGTFSANKPCYLAKSTSTPTIKSGHRVGTDDSVVVVLDTLESLYIRSDQLCNYVFTAEDV